MQIGIDLGGTKIEAIALSPDGRILAQFRRPSPQQDYNATLHAIIESVTQLERELQQRGSVGVGIPGAVSPASGLVKNANSTWLIGRPLDRDLSAALERPVRVANDANCFAVSEAIDGAAAGAACVFGVILGTGVGGGLALGGRVHVGRNAIAGEWGHNPLPWPSAEEMPGPPCYCGRRGCIETFLSGPGLARDYAARGGRVVSPEEIVSRAAAGEAQAEAALRRHEERLARALASVINLLDPDVIVLGGGLSNLTRLYSSLPVLLPPFVFSDELTTAILPPLHGDASGVRGAAWLWPPQAAAPEKGPS